MTENQPPSYTRQELIRNQREKFALTAWRVVIEDYQNARVLARVSELETDWRLYLASADRQTVKDLLENCLDLRDILVAIVPVRSREDIASRDIADIFAQPTDREGRALSTQRWTRSGATVLRAIPSPYIDK